MTLDQIAIKHGTDKSSYHHNYAVLYDRYFGHLRRSKVNLLELGWGGHEDPAKGGESARMWREYFKTGTITVIDNEQKNPDTMVPGVNFLVGLQEDPDFLGFIHDGTGDFDIIVDDASHLSSLTIASFKILWPMVKPGGWYVVEDMHSSYHAWYYGTNEANPDPAKDGIKTQTAMNFFKRVADDVNAKKLDEQYRLYGDVATVHFYEDLVFIQKAV